MDHRFNKHWAVMVIGITLGGSLAAPLRAQESGSADLPDPGTAITRPMRRAATKKVAKRAVVRETDVDDPESQPIRLGEKAAAPLPGEAAGAEDPGHLAVDVLSKLGLVVALMLLCAAVWKRYRGQAPAAGTSGAAAIQVVSTAALGPQRFLHLVNVGRQQILVGSSPQNVSLIAVLEGSAAAETMGEQPGAAARPASERLPGVEEWAEPETGVRAQAEPADRFEELLLRLREMEPGAEMGELAARAAGLANGGGRLREPTRPAPNGARDPAPVPATYGAGARSEPQSRAPFDHAWSGTSGAEPDEEPRGSLAPGSLFRTSRRLSQERGTRDEG